MSCFESTILRTKNNYSSYYELRTVDIVGLEAQFDSSLSSVSYQTNIKIPDQLFHQSFYEKYIRCVKFDF
jgi:hypothetical protein